MNLGINRGIQAWRGGGDERQRCKVGLGLLELVEGDAVSRVDLGEAVGVPGAGGVDGDGETVEGVAGVVKVDAGAGLVAEAAEKGVLGADEEVALEGGGEEEGGAG